MYMRYGKARRERLAPRSTYRFESLLKVIDIFVQRLNVQPDAGRLVHTRARNSQGLLQAFQYSLVVPECCLQRLGVSKETWIQALNRDTYARGCRLTRYIGLPPHVARLQYSRRLVGLF